MAVCYLLRRKEWLVDLKNVETKGGEPGDEVVGGSFFRLRQERKNEEGIQD